MVQYTYSHLTSLKVYYKLSLNLRQQKCRDFDRDLGRTLNIKNRKKRKEQQLSLFCEKKIAQWGSYNYRLT